VEDEKVKKMSQRHGGNALVDMNEHRCHIFFDATRVNRTYPSRFIHKTGTALASFAVPLHTQHEFNSKSL